MLRDGFDALGQNFTVFEDLIRTAERSYAVKNFDAAAAFGQMAADYAGRNHPGLFVSPRLEKLLVQIGENAVLVTSSARRRRSTVRSARHVLHVLTQAYSVGGHTRFIWRWIERDSGRIHSVALTRQRGARVPEQLKRAVLARGGRIYEIDRQSGGLVSRARTLYRLANEVDLIVLHTHAYDVVPVIALACAQHRPPVIVLNHADHLFWLGVSTGDVFAHIRDSGLRLACQRRSIERERSLILPIPLKPADSALSRRFARELLGLEEDQVALLSIAMPYKYKGTSSVGFLEAILPVVRACDKTVLLLVGPNATDFEPCADAELNGRIRFFGRQEDTVKFYRAADIYLDSHPFSSLTSLLEAGSLGVPLVSYNSHPKSSAVLCADDPGLTDSLLGSREIDQYREIVTKLVNDAELREKIGKRTQEEVLKVHGTEWPRSLNALYECAFSMRRQDVLNDNQDEALQGEIDLELERFQAESGLACIKEEVMIYHFRLLPLADRMRVWEQMKRSYRTYLRDIVFPESLSTRLKRAWFAARLQ